MSLVYWFHVFFSAYPEFFLEEEEWVFIAKQKDDMGNKAPTPKIFSRVWLGREAIDRFTTADKDIMDEEAPDDDIRLPYPWLAMVR